LFGSVVTVQPFEALVPENVAVPVLDAGEYAKANGLAVDENSTSTEAALHEADFTTETVAVVDRLRHST
jgi:hypothetical protein